MIRVGANEIALRGLSILLALLLWFAVASDKGARVLLSAPVEIQNLPPDTEIVGSLPRTLDVWVRGTPGLAQKLRAGEVYVPVDLAGAGPGARVVHVSASTVRVPHGVHPIAVVPTSFTLTLDRTLRKTVPIRPILAGEPARGYQVIGKSAEPADVVVSGPEGRIATLDGLPTEPVSVHEAKMTLVREVGLAPTEANVRLLDSPRVRVTVRVEAADAR